MERYLYACDLLNSFEARTYIVVVFGKSWKMAARDDFWDRFDTCVESHSPLNEECDTGLAHLLELYNERVGYGLEYRLGWIT